MAGLWPASLVYTDNQLVDPWLVAHVDQVDRTAVSAGGGCGPFYMHRVHHRQDGDFVRAHTVTRQAAA